MRDNYAIQAKSAQQRFLTYDQNAIIEKFHLSFDESYLYPVMLRSKYRLDRKTGSLEEFLGGDWRDANSFGQVMTLLDMLCDAKPGRYLTGRWKTMQSFGLMFHQNMLENDRDPVAEAIDRDPAWFCRSCQALGGRPISGGDIGYAVELFDGLEIGMHFWHSDEEFFPQLRYFWDENALMYIRYETMYYAVGLLKERLCRNDLLSEESIV